MAISTIRRPFLPAALALAIGCAAPALAAAQEPGTSVDSCAMLTDAQVSAVMGKPVEPGRHLDNGPTEDGSYSTTCLWVAALPAGVEPDDSKPLGGRNFAILNVQNWVGGASAANHFLDSFMKAFEEHEIPSKPVSVSVGADDAIWWGDGVAARKDGISFGVSVVHDGDAAERKPKAESLARQIVQWLEKRPV